MILLAALAVAPRRAATRRATTAPPQPYYSLSPQHSREDAPALSPYPQRLAAQHSARIRQPRRRVAAPPRRAVCRLRRAAPSPPPLMSHLLTPRRQAPRWRSAPPSVDGAPDAYVATLRTPELAKRSELPSTEETPGRADFELSEKRKEDKWWDDFWEREDEEEASDEEEDQDRDDDDEVKDPTYEDEKPTSRKRAAAAGGQRKRGDGQQERKAPRAIILDDDGFPLWPGGCRKQLSDCKGDEVKAYHEAIAKRDAAADAAGADEFAAAEKASEVSPLAKKDNYVAIVDELKKWVARGGAAATAAGWIGRLMIATKRKRDGGGGKGYTPSQVRKLYRGIGPGAA